MWTLELLLCLRRSAERTWSATELIRELRASESIVVDGLRHLERAGLTAPDPDGRYRYRPASSALDGLVVDLERLYRERPSTVTQMIFGTSNEKLHKFADAFRLKKD